MSMRLVQGGILVALIAIGGLLYSIRKQMAPQPAPAAVEAPQTAAQQPAAPAATEALPSVTPAVSTLASNLAAQGTQKPSPMPRSSSPAPRRSSIPREPAPAYSEPAPAPAPVASAPAPAPAYTPSPPPPPPARTVTVPTGTAIAIRLLDGVSSDRNRPGDSFQATLEEPIVADGIVVAERGSNVMGRVVQTQQAGRVAGLSELALELDRIHTVGGEIQIASDTMIRRGETSKGRDAVTVGGMAGLGAAIGAIAGGRKGAGIGAAAGGATGAGTVMATRGKPIEYPPETRLTFRLRAPITVTVDNNRLRSAGEEGRPRLERRY